MNDATANPESRDYLYTNAPAITPEQAAYLRRHGVFHNGPGECAGIRQHETFCGGLRRPTVHVHPSFPAEPVIVHRAQIGIGHTWHTSDRKAAVAIASREDADRRPKHPSWNYKLDALPLMQKAAHALVAFARDFYADGKRLTDKAGYAEAAQALYDAVAFKAPRRPGCTSGAIGSMIWPNVWAKALTVLHPERCYPADVDACVRKMGAEIGWYFRREADDGWLDTPEAMDLTDLVEGAVGIKAPA